MYYNKSRCTVLGDQFCEVQEILNINVQFEGNFIRNAEQVFNSLLLTQIMLENFDMFFGRDEQESITRFSKTVEDIFSSFVIIFIFAVPCLHKHWVPGN